MTTSEELRPNVRYVVTHPSKHGEFKVGDVIWLEEDGAIMNNTIKAWMAAEDVPEATEGMEVKSANPVAQELREGAMCDAVADVNKLTYTAWEIWSKWRHEPRCSSWSNNDHRRTFALLVACALEDEHADQA